MDQKRRPVKAEPVGRRQDLFKTASGKLPLLFPETGYKGDVLTEAVLDGKKIKRNRNKMGYFL